jgi:hypothetical protein
MTLLELIECHKQKAPHSVPDWMLGFWKRYSISFANGTTDLHTHVCWVQSRNFTIDLRLPLERDQPPAKPLHEYSAEELQTMANYEGWAAFSDWDGSVLSWRDTDVTFQLHNRWPEPAFLKRTGNCMIEHCQSNAYVEDWRLQGSAPGMLVGLQLIEEREIASGKIRHKGGGLIICGDYAALTLGRADAVDSGTPLKTLVAEAASDTTRLQQLFNFETSVAIISPEASSSHGYRVMMSTRPERVGQELIALEGFDYLPETGKVRQRFLVEGIACERIFEVDTLEAHLAYPQTTSVPAIAQAWFDRESPTLGRYLEVLN